MNCCAHCEEAGELFNDKTARKELKRYQKKGPLKATQKLIDHVRQSNVEGKTLMDVGGGIGAIQHELFKVGLGSAIQVESSQPYIQAAEEEAQNQGNGDNLTSHFGDFVEMATELPNANFTTLDRVLCCYPAMDKMVGAATEKAQQTVGLVYPKVNGLSRFIIGLANTVQAIRKKDFRMYLYSRNEIEQRFEENGFELTQSDSTFVWHVEVYERKRTK